MRVGLRRRGPSKGFWIALVVGLSLVAIGWCVLPCNAYKQAANMRRAEAHAAKIGLGIIADPRFGSVEVHAYTGGRCGTLSVIGYVKTEADLASLKGVIVASSPPTEVVYGVSVFEGTPEAPDSSPGG